MPVLADRSLGKVLGAAFQPRHYKALARMASDSGAFPATLARYLTGKGHYPWQAPVKTPAGIIRPRLYSHYDLLTLNEIFFRRDYAAEPSDRVIVDIGSNIGLSALYSLTRNPQAFCHLYEPDPRNVERLRDNVSGFASRCEVNVQAVADQEGEARFGLDENSGRYGGLASDFGRFTTVACIHVNRVLAAALDRHGRIDILKIDTEGTEVSILRAIDRELLRRVGKIYGEAAPTDGFHPDLFRREQYGTVLRLVRR